jgi:hypothetical protein
MYKGENWISYENEKSIAIKVSHKYFKWSDDQIKMKKTNQKNLTSKSCAIQNNRLVTR